MYYCSIIHYKYIISYELYYLSYYVIRLYRRSRLTAVVTKTPIACVMIGLFFDAEDRGGMFLRNIDWLTKKHTTLYPKDGMSALGFVSSLSLPPT
jgi:hypothetical protein